MLSPQLRLPLDDVQATAPIVPAAPRYGACPDHLYCTGCTYANHLSDTDTAIMRAHLARLLARRTRQ